MPRRRPRFSGGQGAHAEARPLCPRCGKEVKRPRESKRCPTCGVERPAEAFAHSKIRTDHLDSRCRSCIAAKGRAVVVGEIRPDNPVEEGVVIGNLTAHKSAGPSNGHRGFQVLYLDDATVIDRWTGERTEHEQLEVYHTDHAIRFGFKPGDRVALALEWGFLGKVYNLTRHERAWADDFPDLRLGLHEMLAQWHPEWTLPPLDFWTYDLQKVECPIAAHADRPAYLSWEVLRCSRHTGPDAWGLLDVARRKFGSDALIELNQIEDASLVALATE